jgi:predicted MPP superfamily phosphohydrolase
MNPKKEDCPVPRKAKDPVEFKNNVLLAAAKLFLEKGYSQSTTREIAAAADVNVSTMKQFFGAKENIFTLLIAHRPATFSVARDSGIDLLLCGHVHGGQFRIPLVGGVFGPGQGFFPEHAAGLFVEDATTMIISRGIGNSAFPFRVNNRPEIVVAELHPKK